MLIPLIIVASLAGCIVVEKWDSIRNSLFGKKIAIIGARGVGKTHLCKFLLEGEIPEEYEQTTEPKKFSGRTFKLNTLELEIRDIIDVPGAKDYYKVWEQNCKCADIIFYLVKAYEIFDDNEATKSRIRTDFTRINEWLKSRDSKPLFFVVGTFCDEHAEFINITRSNWGDYKDKFEQKEIIKQLKMLSQNNGYRSAVILGSMKNKTDTEKLVASLLKQVKLKNKIL